MISFDVITFVPVVQRKEQESPKFLMQVQLLPGTHFDSLRSLSASAIYKKIQKRQNKDLHWAYSEAASRVHGMDEVGVQLPVGPPDRTFAFWEILK